MLDNLRQSASQSPFFSNEEPQPEKPPEPEKRPSQQLLGMTPVQRFILVFMLFMIVLVMGSFFLLATEKVVLPFF
jgi:hypothetical protein